MIPYDDLVIALQTWRARQGLSVAQMSGIVEPVPVPPPVEVAAPISRPRTSPPVAPPKSAVPPPLAPVDTRDEDVDDAALLEEAHYENEGDDFAMGFVAATSGQNTEAADEAVEEEHESTSIGTPPPPAAAPRDSFGGSTEPEPGSGKHTRNDDW